MKAAIIAAGRGERLMQGGISVAKPLVPIGGEPLIARVIRAAASVGATSVACIVNDLVPEVIRYLHTGPWPMPLDLVTRTTDNSMESLFSLVPYLREEPFLLLTVDAVFHFEILERFLWKARTLQNARGVLALTRFVDDEKPLWVKTDRRHKIVAIGQAAKPSRYVTAGFYYFNPAVFDLIDVAQARAKALREFLGLLVENQYNLYGIVVSKTIDVDHPADIEKAERYLKERERPWAR